MAENEQSTAALDQAAAEAVDSQQETEQEEVAQEEQVEETIEQVAEAEEAAEELDEDGLPTDHKKRSDLGRKMSAFHRRMDNVDQTLSRLASILEQQESGSDQVPATDPDEPLTVAEWQRLSAQEKAKEERDTKKYNDTYRSAVGRLGGDLTDQQWQDIVKEMESLPLDSSGNAELDAERNFYKASNIYYKKQLAKPAEKEVPLKREIAKNTNVATSQKTVVKEEKMPKLDEYSKSYLDMVSRQDGEEKASKLRKSI